MRRVTATLMLTAILMATGCPPPFDSLEDVWGSSSSDVFVAVRRNTILHYDRPTWSPMTGWSTSEE